MAFDWLSLRQPAPGSLVAAREAAHYAAQWATRAARANLPPAADDSHSALRWDTKSSALATQPLPKGVKIGLDVAKLELVFFDRDKQERSAPSGAWLDRKLAAAGLKPVSGVRLPYEVAEKKDKDPNLAALARWFAAAAEALEEVRAKHARLNPGPVWLWPHHFDLATLVSFAADKSIGIGLSMGDDYYAQPYAYISVYPSPKDPRPPALPPGGHWHTKDFFGAVASADELLAQPDPRAALLAVIDAAVDAGRKWLL